MKEVLSIRKEQDVYHALAVVRHMMKSLHFDEMEKQMVLVSVSELTRNILDHAHAMGYLKCEMVGSRLEIEVWDHGPGIKEVEHVLRGEPGNGKGLGLGLAGVTRLMDECRIETSNEGTRISVVKWPSRQVIGTEHRPI